MAKVSFHFLFFFLFLAACQTPTAGAPNGTTSNEPIVYDGSADSMDSLPDCNNDLIGSIFWVRSDKTGYECSSEGKWTTKSTIDPEIP